METFLEILKYTLPSVIVFLTAFYLIRTFLENENRKKMIDLKAANNGITLPLRYQAYERIILLLERISPVSIVLRVMQPEMSAMEFQSALIQNIRDEFEHNLAQQIYISSTAWELARNAREETIKLINLAGTRVGTDATATDLGSVIFELSAEQDKLPLMTAIEYLKKEVQQLM